jgi:hypothetical protein
MPPGPVPDCSSIPTWECNGNESYCGQIVPFEPDLGDGYWDYPINGETSSNEYRSYSRRDVMLLVKYAAAYTWCVSQGWSHGNAGQPLGLGDMSEATGDIPGTSIGSPGHPAGTHVDGHDMDIAYYQSGTPDNTLRPVCTHQGGGQDAYHCLGNPDLLDPWRTAVFIGMLHVTPQLRVIGVDGKVGPIVEEKVAQLCSAGWLTGPACFGLSLAYEVTDEGRGWYYFHHHHLHISLLDRPSVGWMSGPEVVPIQAPCLTADCSLDGIDRQLLLQENRPLLRLRRDVAPLAPVY